MGSPISEGTLSGSAFSSRDIDILQDKIYLKIDKGFRTAFYRVEYVIRTDTSGKQIPLLFYAKDYQDGISVWIDNQPVKLLDIPDEYKAMADSPFKKFSNAFEQPFDNDRSETVVIYWEERSGLVCDLNDLLFFEIDLAKGEHRIRVEYTAEVWTDMSGWVKEYSFRYSLSPARSWRSFGSLELVVDASDFHSPSVFRTNLGPTSGGLQDGLSVWRFSTLPANFFEILYSPEVGILAGTMIAVGPTGLTLIFGLLVAFLHLVVIKKYRESKPSAKYSWVVIVGSIALPLLMLTGYMFSFDVIDGFIGVDAGSYHGYTFVVLGLYPLLVPVYWIIMWLADRRIKRRISNVR